MDRLDRVALLVAAAAVAYQIFVPPVVGLADNGDFVKVIGYFDLGVPAEDSNKFADTTYTFDKKYRWHSGFYSSELIFLLPALAANWVLSKTGSFDLRLIGACHLAVFLLAFYRFLPLAHRLRSWRRPAVLFLVLFAFTDVMYAGYFNSFYMDTAAYLLLLLAAVSFVRALRWHMAPDRWLLVASVVLLITSKTQHYPLGIPIAVLLAWKGKWLTPKRSRRFAVISAVATLAATVASYRLSPRWYNANGRYTVIFFRLLAHSKNLNNDLAALGLDDSYRRYIGTHAYSEGVPLDKTEFTDPFLRRTSYARIGWFYATHPKEIAQAIISGLDEAGAQRPYLGNFDKSTGVQPFAESRSFAWWSGSKARVFESHGIRYLLYAILLAVIAMALPLRRRFPAGLAAGTGALSIMMLIELLVASLADAVDIPRHYFLFSALADLLLMSVAGMVLARSSGEHAVCPRM